MLLEPFFEKLVRVSAVLSNEEQLVKEQFEVSGSSFGGLVKYFDRNGSEWQIREEIRRMVDFQQFNLQLMWPSLPLVDVIFMRNVLIYFDVESKKDIFKRVRALLKPDGYLFLGGCETTIRIDTAFEKATFDRAACYRLRRKR